MKKYVVASYLVFWVMVLGICGSASMVFHASAFVMRILSNICAWSPTIVLIAMWRKLKPNESFKAFIKENFSGKINLLLILVLLLAISSISYISVVILSLIEHKEISSYFTLGGYSLLTSFLFSITSGPTGEELGWRGYLRAELNNKYGFIRGSVFQGLVWAFWHTVLWFVDSDFIGGIDMLAYIASNVIVMTCLAFIMNVVLEKHKNLVYAVAIHFAFNFIYCFLNVSISFYIILSVIYILAAAVFLLVRNFCSTPKVNC